MNKIKQLFDNIEFDYYMLQNPAIAKQFDNKRGGGLTIQSIIFNKNIWSMEESKKWLKKHGYKYNNNIDIKNNHYRYRQHNPDKFKKFRTNKISSGISFIYGIK